MLYECFAHNTINALLVNVYRAKVSGFFVFVFFHKIEWVDMIQRILNLDWHQSCMLVSKVLRISIMFFFNDCFTSLLWIIGESAEQGLCLLVLVTGGRWHATFDMWQLNCDMWQKQIPFQKVPEKSQNVRKHANKWLKSKQKCRTMSKKGRISCYLWYYRHTPRYFCMQDFKFTKYKFQSILVHKKIIFFPAHMTKILWIHFLWLRDKHGTKEFFPQRYRQTNIAIQ